MTHRAAGALLTLLGTVGLLGCPHGLLRLSGLLLSAACLLLGLSLLLGSVWPGQRPSPQGGNEETCQNSKP